jgi:undecaprenyl-diphosphatase
MLEKIKEWDESLFIWLNSHHSDFLDPIMEFLTQTRPWIPLYIFLVFLCWRAYGKHCWWVILAALLSVAFADQTTSTFMKPFFERLRPCHELSLNGIIHHYGACNSKYGFASSHAANAFAVATLMNLALVFRFPQVRWLFAWSVFFSYTRIYLGVHYPGDVIVGAIVGVLSGYLAFIIFKAINDLIQSRRNIDKLKTD